MMRRMIAFGVAMLAVTPGLSAAVELPSLISDNMVLQRSDSTAVWGRAEPGEKIAVRFNDLAAEIVAETVADAAGRWQVRLDLQKASKTPGELLISGKNTITVRNVVVGEVWLCSGQSNMSWTVDGSENYKSQALDFPQIRQFLVPPTIAMQPLEEIKGQWVVATPSTTTLFTAVGFYFGREIHQRTGHAVGLIHCSWGGTGAEAWTSEPQMARDAGLREMFNHFRRQMAGPSEAAATLRKDPSMPSVLYNGMIAPLTRYRIRGAIWYQGEGNELRWRAYERLLTLMVEGWRRDWGQGDFPFYIVQLANFRARTDAPSADDGWVRIREAQANVARSIPNSGIATAIDLGDAADIHPRNKLDVGRRLAAIAMAKDYGGTEEYSGPVFDAMQVTGKEATLRFKHAGGLNARGGTVKGFAVAGEDWVFHPAEARISGESVIVWSNNVPSPRYIRHAWAANPDVTLYNNAGLPALPFEVLRP